MTSLVFRRTNGDVIASVELSEQQFADIHTVTWDRDKHRLYFSLKYTFHAEIKGEECVPVSGPEPQSKSQAKRFEVQTRDK